MTIKKRWAAGLLTGCLCLGLLAGCGGRSDPEPTPTPTPAEETQTTPDIPGTIVDIPDPENTPETEDFTLELEGMSEQVTMTLVEGQFPDGPKFSLYVDKERYTVNEIDGYCYLTTDAGDSIYAEIGFRPGGTAKDLSGSLLREYGTMQSTESYGETRLGENPARHIGGRTMASIYDAYLIDVDGGCVTLVLCYPPEAAEGAAVRLLASLETLTLS